MSVSEDLTDFGHGTNFENLETFSPNDPERLQNVLQQGNQNKKVGVALYGLGRIGTIHLENFVKNPNVKILYCVEEQLERSLYLKNKWKLEDTHFITPEQDDMLLTNSKVDAVVIGTPTQTHEKLVLRLLIAGKAVMCEKPIALSYKKIKNCYETSLKVKKPLFCAFNRRFDPGFRHIHDLVSRGEIGKVQVIKTCSRDCPLPSIKYLKTSGGIFHDCAVHDIDLICWILDEIPECVSVQAHAFIPDIQSLNDYDTVAIIMKFHSGALGIIDLSRKSIYGYDQRLEVFGSEGMLTSGDLRPTSVQHHTSKGASEVPIFYSFASRYCDAYILESNHFINIVQGSTICEVSASDTLANTSIASACEEAAKSGQTIYVKYDS